MATNFTSFLKSVTVFITEKYKKDYSCICCLLLNWLGVNYVDSVLFYDYSQTCLSQIPENRGKIRNAQILRYTGFYKRTLGFFLCSKYWGRNDKIVNLSKIFISCIFVKNNPLGIFDACGWFRVKILFAII